MILAALKTLLGSLRGSPAFLLAEEAMKYLQIRNWHKFQHYGNKRTPPWIKLHYEIITRPDWVMWDDASKLLAVVCMLIASRNEGLVPIDPEYLKRVGHLSRKPDLRPLIESGFFGEAEVLRGDASGVLALDATTNEDEEEDIEPPIVPQGVPDEFWDIFPKQRRGDRGKADKAWAKAIKKASQEEIMMGVRAYAASTEVAEGYGKGAAAWLNDSRWTHEYKQVGGIVDYEKAKELLKSNPDDLTLKAIIAEVERA